MSGRILPFTRSVRLAPHPLGLYFRAGRNDERDLLNLIATGDAGCFGLVLDPTLVGSQKELRDRALSRRLDVILDPRTQAAAIIGGVTPSLGKLPWGLERLRRSRLRGERWQAVRTRNCPIRERSRIHPGFRTDSFDSGRAGSMV